MSDRHLVIVGAGLAGTWLSRAAAKNGVATTVVTDGEPSADRAALGLLRSTYLAKELRPLMKESLGMWAPEVEVLSGAEVTRWDTPRVKEQKDWHALNPQLPSGRFSDIVIGTAEPVDSRSVRVNDETVSGDAVVWCDGRGDGRRTYGYTWVHDDPRALDLPHGLRIHHVAPYKTLAGARFSSSARVGSSSAASWEKAREQADKLFGLARDLGWLAEEDGWDLVGGTRILREELLTRDEYGWRWSGFHRNGFALAPATAEATLREVLS